MLPSGKLASPQNFYDKIFVNLVEEQLYAGKELPAILEIKRVLKPNGILVLCVPYGGMLNKILDIFWLVRKGKVKYHHYNEYYMNLLFYNAKMKIKSMFTVGKIPWGHILLINSVNSFTKGVFHSYLERKSVRASTGEIGNQGAILYVVAEKTWFSPDSKFTLVNKIEVP